MSVDASPPSDLAARFAESASDIVHVEGRDVRSLLRLEVDPGDVLEVTRLTASRQRPQALKLATDDGELVVASTQAPSVSLWSNSAPRKVRVRVDSDHPTTVAIWNAWRFGGMVHAWIGNAGMVTSSHKGRVTIQCSDGVGPIDFTDLVVTVERTS